MQRWFAISVQYPWLEPVIRQLIMLPHNRVVDTLFWWVHKLHKGFVINQALRRYQKALEVANQIGDRQCVGWAVANIGGVYQEQGDLERALACDEYGLQNALGIGDRWSASIALANMAEQYGTQGNLEQAETLYHKAIGLARAFEINYLHNYLWALADFYARQGRFREAQSLNEEALALAGQARQGHMGGEDVLFKARVLAVRLRLALG